MRTTSLRRASWLSAGLLSGLSLSAAAADVTKADNADNLSLGSAWLGGTVPGLNDVAVWSSAAAGANPLSLGADLSWSGLRILDPSGPGDAYRRQYPDLGRCRCSGGHWNGRPVVEQRAEPGGCPSLDGRSRPNFDGRRRNFGCQLPHQAGGRHADPGRGQYLLGRNNQHRRSLAVERGHCRRHWPDNPQRRGFWPTTRRRASL